MKSARYIIAEIKEYFNLNGSELAREIGVDPCRVNGITNGKCKSISKDMSDRLLERWPMLNPDFIASGELPLVMGVNPADGAGVLSVAERIQMLLRHYDIRPIEFSKRVGWNRSVISGMLSGKQYITITPSRVREVVAAFPEISVKWLRSGYGDMFSGEVQRVDVEHEDVLESSMVVSVQKSTGDAHTDLVAKLLEENRQLSATVANLTAIINKLTGIEQSPSYVAEDLVRAWRAKDETQQV